MPKVYGIDLGTTNSCIAYVNEYNVPTVVQNKDGDRTTPSVVYFGEDGYSYMVGNAAKNGLVADYARTVAFIKREMGKDYSESSPFPNKLTPAEISARILKTLVDDANQTNGGEPCYDVVITCPAYFGTIERKQTRQAGEIAGLNVIRVINEPTAAAVAYGHGCDINDDKDKYVLVYDLGGGTFDITLIRIRKNNYKVVVTGGSAQLGGYDWDFRLAEKLLELFNREGDCNLSFDDEALKNHFMLEAEKIKKMLTDREEVTANIGWEGKSVRVPISRNDFDEWTSDLLEKTMTALKDVLAQAQKKSFVLSSDTDVLLVGGSSRMPQISRRLHEELDAFGCGILLKDPDECVAKGASLIGDIVEDEVGDNEDPHSPVDFSFYDVTAKTYGTDFQKHGDDTCYVRNLIFANSTIPVSKKCSFHTGVDSQNEIMIKIYESDSLDEIILEKDAVVIDDQHIMKLPPDLPAGTPIEISFEIDKQGILKVLANVEGEYIDFQLEIKGVMSSEELENAQRNLNDSSEI